MIGLKGHNDKQHVFISSGHAISTFACTSESEKVKNIEDKDSESNQFMFLLFPWEEKVDNNSF